MTGPGDEGAARLAGRGRLRASHADREQAIEVLKTAFVAGRLTRDELDSRVGQAFASRTYAELAVVTADIPAEPALAAPPKPTRARPGKPGNTTVRTGARVISGATILAASAWAGALLSDNAAVMGLLWAFTFTWFGIVCFVGAVMLESWYQRRPGGQLPLRLDKHRGLEGGPGRTGDDPAPPGARADQTRTDMRTHSSRPGRVHSADRGARAPRDAWPVLGTA
jgi:Domain of unknown function (DUF1707)